MTGDSSTNKGASRKLSLTRQIFLSIVTACAAVAIVVTAASAVLFQGAFVADEHEQLAGECATLCSLLDQTNKPVDAAVTLKG